MRWLKLFSSLLIMLSFGLAGHGIREGFRGDYAYGAFIMSLAVFVLGFRSYVLEEIADTFDLRPGIGARRTGRIWR